MFHDSTGIHFLERGERLASPFLGQADVRLDSFLDQPPTGPIQLIRQPIQLFGQFLRQVCRHYSGCHVISHS
jgi:hypothetical protein